MSNEIVTPQFVRGPSGALSWKGAIPFDRADNDALHLLGGLHSSEIVRWYRQALSYLYRGEINIAADEFAALSGELGNRDIVLAGKLAGLYITHGCIHPSLEAFKAIDEGDRNQTPWHYNVLASAYTQAGRTDDARRIYTRMLALDIADRLETYIALAQTYELENAIREACHVYEMIWDEFPGDGYVGIKLACLWYILQRPEKAEVVLLRILSEPDTDEFVLYQGMAYLAFGNVEMAIPLIWRVRGAYANDPLPPYCLSLCYLLRNQMDRAKKYLREAYEKDTTLWDSEVEMFTSIILTPKKMEKLLDIWPLL